MPKEYHYEIEQDGIVVASVSGPDHNFVRGEIVRYARQYMMDGPISIRGDDVESLFSAVKAGKGD